MPIGFVQAQIKKLNEASIHNNSPRPLPNESKYRGRKLSASLGAKAQELLPKELERKEQSKVAKEDQPAPGNVSRLAGLFGPTRRVSSPSAPEVNVLPTKAQIQFKVDVESTADILPAEETVKEEKPLAVKPKRVKSGERKSKKRSGKVRFISGVNNGQKSEWPRDLNRAERQPPLDEFNPMAYAKTNGNGIHLMTTDPRALEMAARFGGGIIGGVK